VAFVVLTALVAAAVALVVSLQLPRVYESATTLLVGAGYHTSDSLAVGQELTATYAELARTRPVLEAVLADEGLDLTVDELRARVDAVPARASSTVSIVARSDDPAEAARIANAVAAELVDAVPADARIGAAERDLLANLSSVTAELAKVRAEIARLEAAPDPSSPDTAASTAALAAARARLSTLEVTQAALLGQARQPSPETLTIVDPAVAAAAPSRPSLALNVVIGSAAGILFAITLLVLREGWFVARPWRGRAVPAV
jgi:capsular polysaccharide biosynthesis protein